MNISREGWQSSQTVVLAFYNAYADALSAGPLAKKNGAPILLTHKDYLTSVTKDEIKRLGATKVILVGGTGSISNKVVEEIKSIGISDVQRFGGADRFEVAKNIAGQFPDSQKAIIAYGLNFSDALAIAPYASNNGYPILLTKKDSLPMATSQALSNPSIQSTLVIGGEGSVSNAVYSKLKSPQRIGGNDRFEVAANIIKTLGLPTQKVYVATGKTFADALTGSVLAANENAPILLSWEDNLPSPTRQIINERGISNFLILGGLGSVPQQVVAQVSGKLVGLTIVVDPGHGGSDPGAVGNGLKEADLTLDISNRLKSKLQSVGGYIVMTRTADTYVSLDKRVQIANSAGANAFVSIHLNSFSSGSAHGTETYWDDTYASAESKSLANEIQKELIKDLGTNDRGVKEAGFRVIKSATMASVLVEVAFISNDSDANKLATAQFRDKAAQAIYEGILNYYAKN